MLRKPDKVYLSVSLTYDNTIIESDEECNIMMENGNLFAIYITRIFSKYIRKPVI